MNDPMTQFAVLPQETSQTAENEVRRQIKIKKKTVYAFIKRFADMILSLLASIVLMIPIGICAIIIMCKDPGNPFYVHTRVGRDRKPIKVLKLRTMRKGADKLENMLTPEQLEEYRREYKIRDDPRLIGWKKPGDGDRCFGARLRQWSLDEMPQIPYNVLIKGDMSIVGPRAFLSEEQERLPDDRLQVKPGLTCYWQITDTTQMSYEDQLELDYRYIRERGVWTDIKLIWKTIKMVLTGGNY